MKNSTLYLKFATILLLFCSLSSVFAQSTARYNITFSSDWENEIVDPIKGNSTAPIPSNAHWSNLVGATHNSNYKLVEMNTLASVGVKDVAERGVNTELFNEVNSEIANGNADQWLQQGFSPFAAISSATLSNVIVSSDYPLLSLVSMIAPSPDWFIAINSINLRNGNNWQTLIEIPLFPYDAGTDSGTTYTANNQPTTPNFEPVSSLINEGPFNAKPIGTLTITLDQVLSVDSNSINKIALYPNPTNGMITFSTSSTNPLEEVLVHDVLGKQVAKIENQNHKNEINLDLSTLNDGVYLVKLRLFDGSISTKKVVKN
ncbi:spondin domain-containing protein [uncultured Psychroserpens sp.]|uniref:T9SS type A sorting domain-containing protein n=1 Tax=uncultured Psychroserpens sp. TaxID=255436 RepID=UPI002629BA1F|nr:spondin domain-containing protein [uncultured Psychroserpens sp.]